MLVTNKLLCTCWLLLGNETVQNKTFKVQFITSSLKIFASNITFYTVVWLYAYPSSINLVEFSSLNPSYSSTGIVGVDGITRGLVVAIRSARLAPNTNAVDPPQDWDTDAPVDIDHHRLV